jgi:hypothetical protein
MRTSRLRHAASRRRLAAILPPAALAEAYASEIATNLPIEWNKSH